MNACQCGDYGYFGVLDMGEAYRAGALAGIADRKLGFKSDYAYRGVYLDPIYSYAWHYSRGYRDGMDRRVTLAEYDEGKPENIR